MTQIATASPRAAGGRPSVGSLASQGRLPLAFMGLGLVWLIGATAMLAARPSVLALPHQSPPVVALTHAWILGFFVATACGAVYQLAPVALGTTLWSERLAWWHLALHAAGVPGMVIAFGRWDMALVGAFGAAVAAGIALFAVNVGKTVRRSNRSGAVAQSLSLAAGWLLLTVLAGLTLAANRRWGFLPENPLALLRAHAHLGLVGFFVTLLQGVAFQLVPMFTLGEVRDWRAPNTGLWLTQGGLVGLVPSLAIGSAPAATAAVVVIGAGFACSGLGLARMLETRRKRALDPGLAALMRGLRTIAAAALAGLLLLWPGSPWGSAPGGFGATSYALLAVAGGLLPCIAGMMCKIVPFLTWMRAYGPKVGRGPTPPAASLGRPRLERWALALQGAAVPPLVAGAWLLNGPLLDAGAAMLAGGVALFVADMGFVLRHLWRPVEIVPFRRVPTTQ